MRPALETLLQTLLYEGYALYPYTPGAVKNATPTPFGIVYPRAYATRNPSSHDRVRLEAVVHGDGAARLTVELRFLQACGDRHEAVERRVGLPERAIAALACGPLEQPFAHRDRDLEVPLEGALRVHVAALGDDLHRVRVEIENATELEERQAAAIDRSGALRRSLLSTHLALELTGPARFLSPLEGGDEDPASRAGAGCRNVNTWPVLADADDRALLGAAIVLPDHPEIAPQSLGNLFDGTEIEEALLLHIQTLSDAEREAIARSDPAVRAMIERAAAASPDELGALHGMLSPADARAPAGDPLAEDTPGGAGVPEATVHGVRLRRGGRVLLRLGERGNDPYACILDGKSAVLERIYRGYDDRVYLGVSIEDDPGRELLRDTNRFLYFFPDEVEVIEA